MRFACNTLGFKLWRIEWCDRHLCHVTESDQKAILFVIRLHGMLAQNSQCTECSCSR